MKKQSHKQLTVRVATPLTKEEAKEKIKKVSQTIKILFGN